MKEIRDILRFWDARNGQPLALATLVTAQGSSYRRPGARMLINSSGQSVGGVSAGCIEDEVIACSRKVLLTGAPRLLTFDTRLRFGCNGTIQILVELVTAKVMTHLRDCYDQRQPCQLETLLHGDAPRTRIAGSDTRSDSFVQTIPPPIRLILLGDTTDTLALRTQATLLGWNVLQCDATPFPSHLIDDRTAVVIATHNFGRDCAALRNLLPQDLRYLGLIGSRHRRDDILFDVLHNGIPLHDNLYAPAGLHLGAETPEEIALSIIAEIQSAFSGATAQPLRNRSNPIHQMASPQPTQCQESAA